MTREEATILGVGNAHEAASLRDAVMKLCGAFEQHVMDEDAWQRRMEQKLDEMPDMMDAKIQDCSDHGRVGVADAVEFARTEKVKDDLKRAQGKLLAAIIASAGVIVAILLGILEIST